MLLSSNPSICASNGRSCRLRKPSSWRQSSRSTAKRACTRASPKRRALARWPSTLAGLCRASKVCAPTRTVVAGFLDLEHAAVGREADLAQLGQIAQKSSHAEVVGIVNGGFGTQARTAPARFVILLEVRVFIIDVQRRDDPPQLRCASCIGRRPQSICAFCAQRSTARFLVGPNRCSPG
jgi:hypothetical protein